MGFPKVLKLMYSYVIRCIRCLYLLVAYVVALHTLSLLTRYICCHVAYAAYYSYVYLVAYLSASALLHIYTSYVLKIKTHYVSEHLSTLMLRY